MAAGTSIRRFRGRRVRPRWVCRVAVVLALCASGWWTMASSAEAQSVESSPVLALNPGLAAPGQRVIVTGTGWPPFERISISICGNGGDGGTLSCDRARSVVVASDGDGDLYASLVTGIPPVECPCVVRGFTTSGTTSATTAIEIPGAPDAPRTGDALGTVPSPTAQVSILGIDGHGPPAAWFGGASERVVRVSLLNAGATPIVDPVVTVSWGRDEESLDNVVRATDAVRLEPGASTVIDVPIAMEPLSVGRYVIQARSGLGPVTSSAMAGTTVLPWGLVALALVLLQVVLVKIRNVLRRRHRRLHPLPGGVPASASAAPHTTGAPVVVLDAEPERVLVGAAVGGGVGIVAAPDAPDTTVIAKRDAVGERGHGEVLIDLRFDDDEDHPFADREVIDIRSAEHAYLLAQAYDGRQN